MELRFLGDAFDFVLRWVCDFMREMMDMIDHLAMGATRCSEGKECTDPSQPM
jgi:hypothetical protein